jgi:hypothetical protein
LISEGRNCKVCWERLVLSEQRVVEGCFFFSFFQILIINRKRQAIYICYAIFFHIYLLCYFFFSPVVESLSQHLGISTNLNKSIYHLIIKTIKTLSFSIKINTKQ